VSGAGEFIDNVIAWDGGDNLPIAWAQAHEGAILAEAANGKPGVIADALGRLADLADNDATAASLGFAGLFSSLQEAASTAFHKLWGFVSTGARHVKPLWNALAALFHRYGDKLKKIAGKLGATGYTLALNIPLGFSCGLNFDFR
jgi:hypothetical protein